MRLSRTRHVHWHVGSAYPTRFECADPRTLTAKRRWRRPWKPSWCLPSKPVLCAALLSALARMAREALLEDSRSPRPGATPRAGLGGGSGGGDTPRESAGSLPAQVSHPLAVIEVADLSGVHPSRLGWNDRPGAAGGSVPGPTPLLGLAQHRVDCWSCQLARGEELSFTPPKAPDTRLTRIMLAETQLASRTDTVLIESGVTLESAHPSLY